LHIIREAISRNSNDLGVSRVIDERGSGTILRQDKIRGSGLRNESWRIGGESGRIE
jgi:hypothetical protein